MPVRVVLVALLLAGLGLWQSWQCNDDMAPLLLPVTTTTVHAHGEPVSDRHADEPSHGDGHSLASVCMSVLAAVAAAFLLMGDPLRLLRLLKRAGQILAQPVEPLPRAASLAQLCVLRT
jgi:hypothetical protein